MKTGKFSSPGFALNIKTRDVTGSLQLHSNAAIQKLK